ncbi:hypothetical protein E3N88_11973 [Mikania micrantha]|uniref:Aminotransferase-like plant mobile domain-containing protein n=1 Tax=Mikania micrantha TaxID=192012 RepID=A0A5N6P467_9ASTR|nr:hypothetical protein E3N88_11973 [Mikania micrantha]
MGRDSSNDLASLHLHHHQLPMDQPARTHLLFLLHDPTVVLLSVLPVLDYLEIAINMTLSVNPGPSVNDLLFIKDGHRATHLFNSNDYGDRNPLNVRRGDKRFWQYIKNHPIHLMVKNILNDTGFGGLIDYGYRKVDLALITALVEIWRPETHTFHLTVGEVTVTLQDVNQYLW